jgi:hypothetical protein
MKKFRLSGEKSGHLVVDLSQWRLNARFSANIKVNAQGGKPVLWK